MFDALKRLWRQEDSVGEKYDAEAEQLAAEITRLENRLAENPADRAAQQTLMLRYNRALQLYAKSRNYRRHIDPLFVKMDELRNIIRKNISTL